MSSSGKSGKKGGTGSKRASAADRGAQGLPSAATDATRRHECLVETAASPRADRYIAETLGILSRSQLKARGAAIEVNGRVAKLSRPLKSGDRLVVTWTDEVSPALVPEALPLDILFEDDRVMVVNKAAGMVTHPGAGNRRGTLVNAVLGHLAALPTRASSSARVSAPQRGGIVHRLDKDTSGVIIIAKDAEAQAFLAGQFKDRSTRKEYLALTVGLPRGFSGRIENRLGRDRRDRKRFAEVEEGGRIAITEWRVIAVYGDFALQRLRPRTGRTHQLRVHMEGLGTPIAGDPIYGSRDRRAGELGRQGGAGLMLHAWKLAITLPGADKPSLFKAPLPRRFSSLLSALEARYGRTSPPEEGRGAVDPDNS